MALLNVTFILSHIIVYRCITSVRLDGVWTKRNTIAIVEVGYEFETGSKDERIWIGTNHDGIDSQAERSKLSPHIVCVIQTKIRDSPYGDTSSKHFPYVPCITIFPYQNNNNHSCPPSTHCYCIERGF